MGTYDTIGGTPRHDPAFDYDPPCAVCGLDPYGDYGDGSGDGCNCQECPVCRDYGNPRCYGEHGMTVDLCSADPAHRLRNAPLSEIGAEYRSRGSGGWKRITSKYRIANCTFNELGTGWTHKTEWRATNAGKGSEGAA